MNLNDKQRDTIKNLVEKAKNIEYHKFNTIIANAVKEWQNGDKTDAQAYNKIYKKVIKNEYHLVYRYADLTDEKLLRTLAEVFVDDIIDMNDFINVDALIKEEIYRISGIKK